MNFPQNLLLTVRGISANSSPQVMSIVQSNNEIGLYNPWYNDRVQLANTIHMITTLDLQPGNNYTPTFFHNEEVTNLIKRLNDINIPF